MIEKIVEEIINDAREGKITIPSEEGDWTYFAKFYINEVIDRNYPTIEVPNYKAFIKSIKDYLSVAYDFYYADKNYSDLNDKGYLKQLIFTLLVNASSFDCLDIYNYIDNKKKALLDKTIKEEKFVLGEYNGLEIKAMIKKNSTQLEAPYQFIITLKDSEGNIFELPQITFFIVDGCAHLMCVQNKNKNDNGLVKKLNRYFRKVNKDVDMEDDIGNVSPNALVSLTIFNAYLKDKEIEKVILPAYLPIRYNSKLIKQKHRGLSKIELELELDKINRDQFNITNKLMYLVQRYVYHFSNCSYEYDENRDIMILTLNNKKVKGDNIIFDIDDSVLVNTNENKKTNR